MQLKGVAERSLTVFPTQCSPRSCDRGGKVLENPLVSIFVTGSISNSGEHGAGDVTSSGERMQGWADDEIFFIDDDDAGARHISVVYHRVSHYY